MTQRTRQLLPGVASILLNFVC